MHPGEQLRLVLSGHNLAGAPMLGVSDVTPENHGRHVIHTGGPHDSCLRLPVRVARGRGVLTGS
jgi:predicted acyl esterase